MNGPSNRAARGSVIQIFGTGAAGPATVTIDGVDEQVIYAGPAPQSVDGLLQVNAIVPVSVVPGTAVPLVLTIGSVNSPDHVTIAIN